MLRKETQVRVTAVITACFLGLLALLFACIVAFALPQTPRYPEAIQTAEVLISFQPQAPAYLQIDTNCLYSQHCFTILLGSFPAMSRPQLNRVLRSLIVTIDGDVRSDFYASMIDGNIYAEIPPLSAGLHLIQVEIQDKNKNWYRHSWALELSEDFAAQATQALPPTPLESTP